ncbi:hypothetical protein F4560_008729 [Saccharothrix ecbatanensis]|uniref:Uncharacterized protein n=1 Tax=Saccharothrix ecbatanensis TaxID=1105145 RepID=A0A7W9M676_9PSEU|nr:hypothetical protein [Saccharothrix ecbatanensis]MBB5808961.1 hypothetical protein [Saccharothrix ecbatanensis]
MTEPLPPVLFRRSVGLARPVDPHEDLGKVDQLLRTLSPDYPGLGGLRRHREELVTALYGKTPELDLHLDGESVRGHATDAALLARFVGASAAVVKEVTKSIQGLRRLVSNLQVMPGTGSVRLTFTPSAPEAPPGAISPERLARVETAGLRRLVALMAVAENTEDPTGAEVAAALQDLNMSARRAVGAFALATLKGEFEVRGVWHDPRRGTAAVKLSRAAASRLNRASRSEAQEVASATLEGTIDGWTWSSSTVGFVPTAGRPFRATVPEHLAEQVALLGGHRDLPVVASFTVVTTYAQGTNQAKGQGYSLESIAPLRAEPSLLDGTNRQ